MPKTMPAWQPARIAALLDCNDLAVERAVIAIFRRQTADEQATEETRHRNHRGFAACHARRGSYYARWCLAGRHLDGQHLALARRMTKHYTAQLAEVAAEKSESRLLQTA